MNNVEELKRDIEELKRLFEQATRQKVKDLLLLEQRKVETELIRIAEIKNQSEFSNASASDDQKAQVSAPTRENKRYLVDINTYGWDQSDRFVQIFITLDGSQGLTDNDIETIFTEKSLQLTAKNLNNKDYLLVINNLLYPIDTVKSYKKIKTDMIVVYLKKQTENQKWSHLTTTEKRVHEMKNSALKPDENFDETAKDDPTAGLMNIVKKLYQSGDPEMKRMIAKAWSEKAAGACGEGSFE